VQNTYRGVRKPSPISRFAAVLGVTKCRENAYLALSLLLPSRMDLIRVSLAQAVLIERSLLRQ